MALSQFDLIRLLESLRSTDGIELIRAIAERMVQELIEAEASAHIGAEWNEHTPTRTNVRNGHRDKEPFQRGHRSSDAGVMRWVCATDRAPVPLREVFDVSTQQHRSP
ncbi:transposase, partial [Streptomyces sp. RP5T]|uniref:transposase n=1 Tax=Streptomyces sp. RP5T TaxID=2490848 RepID=UPI0021AD8EEA